MKKILIINGPNLNLLGKREPILYGSDDFESFFRSLQQRFAEVDLSYVQSNSEGDLMDAIHRGGETVDGIVLNPAAYTHTSIAIADAVRAVDVPVIEVHISNVFAREGFRRKSFVSPVAAGVIVGMGPEGYALAVRYLADL